MLLKYLNWKMKRKDKFPFFFSFISLPHLLKLIQEKIISPLELIQNDNFLSNCYSFYFHLLNCFRLGNLSSEIVGGGVSQLEK